MALLCEKRKLAEQQVKESEARARKFVVEASAWDACREHWIATKTKVLCETQRIELEIVGMELTIERLRLEVESRRLALSDERFRSDRNKKWNAEAEAEEVGS
jgi:hypothetical protein